MSAETKIKGRYYAVKFYNHNNIYVMYFNGKNFEAFKSEEPYLPHDEIESYRLFSAEHL